MGYCTVEDVKDLIKEDMYNMIIGCEYLDEEKAEEKEAKIDELTENAIVDANVTANTFLNKFFLIFFPPRIFILKVYFSTAPISI